MHPLPFKESSQKICCPVTATTCFSIPSLSWSKMGSKLCAASSSSRAVSSLEMDAGCSDIQWMATNGEQLRSVTKTDETISLSLDDAAIATEEKHYLKKKMVVQNCTSTPPATKAKKRAHCMRLHTKVVTLTKGSPRLNIKVIPHPIVSDWTQGMRPQWAVCRAGRVVYLNDYQGQKAPERSVDKAKSTRSQGWEILFHPLRTLEDGETLAQRVKSNMGPRGKQHKKFLEGQGRTDIGTGLDT